MTEKLDALFHVEIVPHESNCHLKVQPRINQIVVRYIPEDIGSKKTGGSA